MIVLGDYRHRKTTGAAPEAALAVPPKGEGEPAPKDATKEVAPPASAAAKKIELARFETLRKELVDAVVTSPPVKLDITLAT